MKKLIAIMIAGLITTAAHASVTTNANGQIVETFTNAFGQVMDVVIGHAGSATIPSKIAAAPMVVIGTAAPTATPDSIGQFAIDRSDAAYVAVGGTASDWRPIPQVQLVTAASTAMNTITPRSLGHIVAATGTNKVVAGSETGRIAIAVGLTTNDWVLISTAD